MCGGGILRFDFVSSDWLLTHQVIMVIPSQKFTDCSASQLFSPLCIRAPALPASTTVSKNCTCCELLRRVMDMHVSIAALHQLLSSSPPITLLSIALRNARFVHRLQKIQIVLSPPVPSTTCLAVSLATGIGNYMQAHWTATTSYWLQNHCTVNGHRQSRFEAVWFWNFGCPAIFSCGRSIHALQLSVGEMCRIAQRKRHLHLW